MHNDAPFAFTVTATDGGARSGTLRTAHGEVETPAFVTVATQASIKGVSPASAAAAGTQLLFANTYHLSLRPGAEVVAAHGGLHRFMNWPGPILTDSGGFQVFSLGAGIEHGVGKVASVFPGENATGDGRAGGESLVEVSEEGVHFRSHVDGSRQFLTPERSIALQRALGADVILAFDECTSPLHDEAYTAASAERTHRWAERSLRAFRESAPRHGYPQALYGIVQGGAFRALRERSAEIVAGMGFDGVAVGGNLGRTREAMHRVLEWTAARLPAGPPRHLLGIGDVQGVFEAVARGMDTFDCVAPTRNARNGGVLARFDDDGRPLPAFRLNLKNARFADDPRPIDPECDCEACRGYGRAYLRHLLKAGEPLGAQLATLHNLRFMARLMASIRESIRAGRFDALREAWLAPVSGVADAGDGSAPGG